MTIRVAILDDYQNVAMTLADWSPLAGRAEPVVFNDAFADADVAAAALAEFPVIVAMRERTPFPADLLARLPNCRLLITTGMRNFAIDMSAAKQSGILVCGTELLPYPAAELTWGLILALSLNIPHDARTMAEGGWQTRVGQSLYGRTLGIIGLGKQGKQVARFANAFHMEVLAWSRNLTAADAAGQDAKRVELDELLAAADIVTLHVVLNEGTRGLIGARELGLMKPEAFLVNTARGPVVDEAALLEALNGGRIAGAAIDVYEQEPLPADHPLRRAPNTVLTPHMGYVTRENLTLMYSQAIEDIAGFLDGSPVRVLNG
ncbi:MAG: D-2-hydroxyacid dehydrogenase family protein [Rhodospirillales bacterium]|nr:MAG: D-2-hydroxyacid dehydrogenase family protein [Rhodospirillales bacterium]